MNPKIYIIAGEPSGDLHGAHLVKAIRRKNPDIEFRGFGGPKMEEAGVLLDQHIDRLSFMGFAEVIAHLPQIMSNFSLAKKNIRAWAPDAVVYVDFPGFNMRMAKWAHQHGYKNFYYIAPQAWAWKAGRAHALRKYVDELFCILPFEKDFFSQYGIDARYVGHPLLDIISEYRKDHTARPGGHQEKILALLPGSRAQEVKNVLPLQLQAARKFPDHKIILARSPNVSTDLYRKIFNRTGMEIPMENSAYDLLARADIAAVSSGTATLETALFHVPQVVCFKGNRLSYHIAKNLIKVPYISLVNLIMGEKIVTELIQSGLSVKNLEKELENLIRPGYAGKILHAYHQLEKRLGVGGAADKTANIILSRISE